MYKGLTACLLTHCGAQIETVEWTTAGEIMDKVRQLGHMLTKAHSRGTLRSVVAVADGTDKLTPYCNTHAELAIGNVVRRVLYIIREEYLGALKTEAESKSALLDAAPKSNHNYQSARSLGTILTPGTDTDLSIPIADLKLVRLVGTLPVGILHTNLCCCVARVRQSVNEGIAELIDEIDSLHVNIADQAMEYIHAE